MVIYLTRGNFLIWAILALSSNIVQAGNVLFLADQKPDPVVDPLVEVQRLMVRELHITRFIDHFAKPKQNSLVRVEPPKQNVSRAFGLDDVLGGERDVEEQLNQPPKQDTPFVESEILQRTPDTTDIEHRQNSSGATLISWDGVDGTHEIKPDGLGGVDLTAFGAEYFVVLITSASHEGQVDLEVYDASDPKGKTVVRGSMTYGISEKPQRLLLRFDAMLGQGPVDFKNVGAITLRVDGSAPHEMRTAIDYVALAAPNCDDELARSCFSVGTFDRFDLTPTSFTNPSGFDDGSSSFAGPGIWGFEDPRLRRAAFPEIPGLPIWLHRSIRKAASVAICVRPTLQHPPEGEAVEVRSRPR